MGTTETESIIAECTNKVNVEVDEAAVEVEPKAETEVVERSAGAAAAAGSQLLKECLLGRSLN